ncbi:ABC-2 type transporter family protein [Striga asiatica]|uniref:ABC-2 type transporter family protein n=1 Tax=Striga asiatica TaxID=4170 RepID=A0A5A7PZX6_STRAF|nr:ABC-2 type transporter family protein [Striga asiatica]
MGYNDMEFFNWHVQSVCCMFVPADEITGQNKRETNGRKLTVVSMDDMEFFKWNVHANKTMGLNKRETNERKLSFLPMDAGLTLPFDYPSFSLFLQVVWFSGLRLYAYTFFMLILSFVMMKCADQAVVGLSTAKAKARAKLLQESHNFYMPVYMELWQRFLGIGPAIRAGGRVASMSRWEKISDTLVMVV